MKTVDNVTIYFESKPPYTTNYLVVTWTAPRPDLLFEHLRTIGWVSDQEREIGEGRFEATWSMPGAGFMATWTGHQRRKCMQTVRTVLARHGFSGVPVIRLVERQVPARV